MGASDDPPAEMNEIKCVICEKPIERRPANPYFPFCSHRCRLIDLGKWMGGDYRIPGEPVDESEIPVRREGEEEEGE